MFKQLAGFMRNQFIADIIFIFKIQIECTLGNACIFRNLCNRGLADTFGRKRLNAVLSREVRFCNLFDSNFPITSPYLQFFINYVCLPCIIEVFNPFVNKKWLKVINFYKLYWLLVILCYNDNRKWEWPTVSNNFEY